MILLQCAEHTVDTSLFLLHIRMDIEVERDADVGMPQQNAHSLIVAFAFDAARSETVPQTVKFHRRQAERQYESFVIVPVGARFGRLWLVCQNVEISVHYFLDGTDHL